MWGHAGLDDNAIREPARHPLVERDFSAIYHM